MSPLLQLLIAKAPEIIDGFKRLHREAHPEAPDPTNEQVIDAFHAAFMDSVARDAFLSAVLKAEIAAKSKPPS